MLNLSRKIICLTLSVAFISASIDLPQSYAGEMVMPIMPAPGRMVNLSPAYTPAYLKGIIIHPEDPLKFDFLVDHGEGDLDADQKREEYGKLIKYFLASLTVPDQDQWVNLSPYEKDRIIKDDFGKTEMGRDLLAQDYLLKQITSSLIYPESALGKVFWNKVYARAYQEYGSTNIPVNTFNKVWILPDQAEIHESGNTAYVVKSHLKVMLEQDYLALMKASQGNNRTRNDTTNALGSQIVTQIILPELTKEVNEGKNFAMLRQVFSGMILAAWYKKVLKDSLLGRIYADKSKVNGVMPSPTAEAWVQGKVFIGDPAHIYQQYLIAFKKGVYNYIKEDEDIYTKQRIPRKYFAGGFHNDLAVVAHVDKVSDAAMASELNSSPALDDVLAQAVTVHQASAEGNNKRMAEGLNKLFGNKATQWLKKLERIKSLPLKIRQKKERDATRALFINDQFMELASQKGDIVENALNIIRFLIENGINPYTNSMKTFKASIDTNGKRLKITFRMSAPFVMIMKTTVLLTYDEVIRYLDSKGFKDLQGEEERIQGLRDLFTSFDDSFRSASDNIMVESLPVPLRKIIENGPPLAPIQTPLGLRMDKGLNELFGEGASDWIKELGKGNEKKSTMVVKELLANRDFVRLFTDHEDYFPNVYHLIRFLVERNINPQTTSLRMFKDMISWGNPTFNVGFKHSNTFPVFMHVNVLLNYPEIRAYLDSRPFKELIGRERRMQDLKSELVRFDDSLASADNKYIWNSLPQEIQSEIDDKAMNSRSVTNDSAQLSGMNSLNPGGIDMNAANLNLLIKRDGNGAVLPVSQQDIAQLSRISGLTPQILEIKPANTDKIMGP